MTLWDLLERVERFLPISSKETNALAISPDARLMVAARESGEVRIWDVPEGKPTHSLPYDELLAFLRAQTNMRVVGDPSATEGYRVEYEKWPGWETNPPSW